MCRRIECDECHKPTFAGCGMHVEEVLGDVPRAARCGCREKRAEAKADARAKGGAAPGSSIFARLFGK